MVVGGDDGDDYGDGGDADDVDADDGYVDNFKCWARLRVSSKAYLTKN